MRYKIKNRFFVFVFLAAVFLLALSFSKTAKADDAADCAAYCKGMGGTSEEMSACNKTCIEAKAKEASSKSSTSSGSSSSSSSGGIKYVPLENIPGFEDLAKTGDFPQYILAVYRMGLWTIGICALVMILIGGFMYITSAGNTSSMGTAKKYIVDALIGILLAFTSYLLLYTINPELVKLPQKAGTQGTGSSSGSGTSSSTSGNGTKYGNGTCQTMDSGPCSVENLKAAGFGDKAEAASMICNKESGGQENRASEADICKGDGNVASFGLFQCNISANKIGGLNCPSAFSSMYTGKNKNCSVTNQGLYEQCKSAATTASSNIAFAASASKNGTNWGPWKNSANACGL